MIKQKLVLVSMDALIFEDLAYLSDKPAFRRCMDAGARVERVRSIYPTLTYPCHATMASGCLPAVHGIINNTFFSPGTLSPDWLWFHGSYGVRDLCDAAKEAGLTTACIGWPTMGNHPHVDYLVGEIAGTKARTTEEFRAHYQLTGTPDQLWEEICLPHIHHRTQQRNVADFNNAVCCEIIRRYAPDLTMLHLGEPDHTRHSSGLFGPAVYEALDQCERQLEQLMQAIQDSGEAERINLVITADHGHMNYSRLAAPNVLLAQNGFLELDESGGVRSWRAWCTAIGLCTAVYVKDPADERAVFALLKQWEGQGFSRIYTRDEAAREGFSGPFSFVLETDDQTAFRDHWTGDYLTPVPGPRSGHGFHPDKGPRPTLIALGPAFRKGVVLPHAHLIDGAPTWAALLGLDLPDAQGRVLTELLNL